MKLSSQDIVANQEIDIDFTKYGKNNIPELSWQDVPEGTAQLVLLCYDIDTVKLCKFVWMHWVVFDIDLSTNTLVDGKYTVGKNDFKGRKVYDGPMPPPNTGVHHYIFKLYALNKCVELDAETKYSYIQLVEKLQDFIIAESEIMTSFEKK